MLHGEDQDISPRQRKAFGAARPVSDRLLERAACFSLRCYCMPGRVAQPGALLCLSQSARRSPVPQRCLTCILLSWPPQTFSLHIGADLKLPTPNARRHSSYEVAPAAVSAAAAASDPFAGLPFRAMAERLGAAMSPVVQAVSPKHVMLHAAATPCTALAVSMQTPNMHSIWFAAGGSGGGPAGWPDAQDTPGLECLISGVCTVIDFALLSSLFLAADVASLPVPGAGGRSHQAAPGRGPAGRAGAGARGAPHPPLPPLHPLVCSQR